MAGRLSVCLSFRHTAVLYKNGASYDHEIFTTNYLKVSSFLWQNFVLLGDGVPLELKRQKRVPPLKDVIWPIPETPTICAKISKKSFTQAEL